jgi:hypothetical protein
MRTSILECLLFTFLTLNAPVASQESRPESRASTKPPSPGELVQLLSGHWNCRAIKQPSGESVSHCDHVVNEVLPGGRWFVSFTGSDGPAEMFWWKFQALELILDQLITRSSGVETVWRIEGSRMMMTHRSPMPDGGTREMDTFELIKE